MQFIKPETNIDFIGRKNLFLTISGIAVTISVILVLTLGLSYGIDFAGGTEIVIQFNGEKDKIPEVDAVRGTLEGVKDIKMDVQTFGDLPGEYLIKMESITYLTEEKSNNVKAALVQEFGAENLKRFSASETGGDKIEFHLPRMKQEAPAPVVPEPAVEEQAAAEGEEAAPAEEAKAEEAPVVAEKEEAPKAADPEALLPGEEKAEIPADAVDIEKLKALFAKAGVPAFDIKVDSRSTEDSYRYVVTLEGVYDVIRTALDAKFGAGTHELLKLDTVGPRVGEKLKQDGMLAVLYSLIGILIYIALRFEFKFAPGAVAALTHDVLITMGVFAIIRMEFDLTTIAALLTIVGYSLNDTIVVFDRIREHMGLLKRMTIEEVFNKAINETLSRTLLTSMTTFMVVFVIWLLTVGSIQHFAFAMMIGVLIGTYSSIFIASPFVIILYKYMKKREEQAVAPRKNNKARA